MKLLLRVLGYVAVATTAVITTLLVVLVLWLVNSDRPYPDAFRDLPEETLKIPAAVQEIASKAFPAGTPEKSMIATLSSWGFVFSYAGQRLTAEYVAGGIVCITYLTIGWTSHDHDRLVQVTTETHLSCL